MARFTLPRDLYHGENALEALKTLDGKRAIVGVGFIFVAITYDFIVCEY